MEYNDYTYQLKEIIRPFNSIIDETVKNYKDKKISYFEKDGFTINVRAQYKKAAISGMRGKIIISHKDRTYNNAIEWKGFDGGAMWTTKNFRRKITTSELKENIDQQHCWMICYLLALEIQKRIG